MQPAKLTGLYKFSSDGYAGGGLGDGVKWDFVYLLILLLHRHMLQRKGHWNSEARLKKAAAAE